MGRGSLTAVASLGAEHWLYSEQASVIAVPGLSFPVACGIFPDKGSNLFSLHGQQILIHWTNTEVPVYNLLSGKCSRGIVRPRGCASMMFPSLCSLAVSP